MKRAEYLPTAWTMKRRRYTFCPSSCPTIQTVIWVVSVYHFRRIEGIIDTSPAAKFCFGTFSYGWIPVTPSSTERQVSSKKMEGLSLSLSTDATATIKTTYTSRDGHGVSEVPRKGRPEKEVSVEEVRHLVHTSGRAAAMDNIKLFFRFLIPISIVSIVMFGLYAAMAYSVPNLLCKDLVDELSVRAELAIKLKLQTNTSMDSCLSK